MLLLKCAAIALLLSAGVANAAPKTKEAAQTKDVVVAVVDGQNIYLNDLKELKDSVPQLKALPMDALYDQLLESMVDSTLLDNAAAKAKLQNDPEYKKMVAELERQVMRRLYLEKRVREKRTKNKMQDLYKQYLKDNPPQEEIRASHILVTQEKDAEDIIQQLNAGADFAEIANKKSIDASGNGGDLGYFTRETMVPEFAEAAFSMKKGEISKKPVKTQFGYHIIKLEDRRMGEPMAFDDVEEQLTERFNVQAAQDTIKELREKAKIQKFDIHGKSAAK